MTDMTATKIAAAKPLGLPWRDHAGNLSPFRAVVFALLFLPGLVLAVQYETGTLGPRPFDVLIHQTGLWTIRLLFLSLAITPFRQIFRLPELATVRRMVGVAAFVYGMLHLAIYATDQAFDLGKIAGEIVLRVYLTIGFAALVILLALAVTSTDGMMKRLGGRRWRTLHRAVYVAAALAVIHHFMQAKVNIAEATVMAGLFCWLMLHRLAAWWLDAQRLRGPGSLTALALAAALLTALAEYGWYALATGVDPLRVLAANWHLAVAPRPAAVVLAMGLAVTLAAAARPIILPASPRRLRA